MIFQWHVTERCNLRCSHCYQDSYNGADSSLSVLLGILRQFEDMLRSPWEDPAASPGAQPSLSKGCSRTVELPRNMPPIRGHVSVTGGEPFLREDLFELLEALATRKDFFTFGILTNGTLIDRATARRLKSLNPAFVQVSVEGARAMHDEIRGRGSYELTVTGLKNLVREKIPTYISFTAHRANFRDFSHAALLGRKLGVARVWADRVIPTGKESGQEALLPEETLEFVTIMKKAREEARSAWFNRTEIAMHRALQFLGGGGAPYRCSAGASLLAIDSDGTLYPCRRMPIAIGNVLETPLRELYQTSAILRGLRERARAAAGCEGCLFTRSCGGGLRCLSYAATRDPFRADPGCPLAWTNAPPA